MSVAAGEPRTRLPATHRRHALLEGSFALIAEKELEGLRLRDVAARAGIDHSTLQHCFPTKRHLIAAVVEYATQRFWTTIGPDASPRDQVRRHLRLTARLTEEESTLVVVLRELDLRATRDLEVRAIIGECDHGWRASLNSLFERGSWPEGLDTTAGTELVVAAVKGAAFDPTAAIAALGQLERLLIPQKEDQ